MILEGFDSDAMIVGMMSATFITFWLETVDNIPKAASAIMFSGLLSGIAPAVVSIYAIDQYPFLAQAGNALTLLAAVLIGASVTWGFPILINYVKNRWGGSNA